MDTIRRYSSMVVQPSYDEFMCQLLCTKLTGVLFIIYGVFTFIFQAVDGWNLFMFLSGTGLFFVGFPLTFFEVETREPRFRTDV